MSPLAITTPSQPLCADPSGPGRVGICAYRPTLVNVYTVCYHGHMRMCKHAHLYRSASAPGWLTPKSMSTSQPQIRRPLPSPKRHRHIAELICEINSSIDFVLPDVAILCSMYASRSRAGRRFISPRLKSSLWPATAGSRTPITCRGTNRYRDTRPNRVRWYRTISGYLSFYWSRSADFHNNFVRYITCRRL